MKKMHYNKLLLMGAFHFIIMFALMYSMVYVYDHIYLNINKAYMAAIMTAPMLFLETVMMGSMYKNNIALTIIAGVSLLILFAVFLFIRRQTFIYDQQFLRSMIPHHSSAILMCERANISDREIKDLCDEIVKTQKEEINIMEDKLKSMK